MTNTIDDTSTAVALDGAHIGEKVSVSDIIDRFWNYHIGASFYAAVFSGENKVVTLRTPIRLDVSDDEIDALLDKYGGCRAPGSPGTERNERNEIMAHVPHVVVNGGSENLTPFSTPAEVRESALADVPSLRDTITNFSAEPPLLSDTKEEQYRELAETLARATKIVTEHSTLEIVGQDNGNVSVSIITNSNNPLNGVSGDEDRTIAVASIGEDGTVLAHGYATDREHFMRVARHIIFGTPIWA